MFFFAETADIHVNCVYAKTWSRRLKPNKKYYDDCWNFHDKLY